jgi:NAD+ synthase
MESQESSDLTIDLEKARTLLVGFLRDETRNAGFSSAVLGLSGGVDSAVVAHLAVEALGQKNVLAVIMPYRSSSPNSKVDAERVVTTLGIKSEVVDITPMVEPLLASIPTGERTRRGNVMARERMIILYDISAREKALVYGTSNKTELLLGYGTLFGDLASALNPLGDLYKTQIWQLARHLGVAAEVVAKPPSADLWDGQTDEGEFGFTYERADRLLHLMIDQRVPIGELEKLGWEKPFIEAVAAKVRISQFKRRPPLIGKVSGRTVNIDFRYPRDWGI